MKINNLTIPIGHPNRPGQKLKRLDAIVVHYTANDRPGADDLANARYFGRAYRVNGEQYFEADGVTPFRYGSTHVVCDMDSATICIPADEVAWHVGDRRQQKDGSFGYTQLALAQFAGEQNYRTVGVEICNNDIIPNSNQDWLEACEIAKAWISGFINRNGLKVCLEHEIKPGHVMILRHHDLTNKLCPLPFVEDLEAWHEFVEDIAGRCQ